MISLAIVLQALAASSIFFAWGVRYDNTVRERVRPEKPPGGGPVFVAV